jgi:hypothetical protein
MEKKKIYFNVEVLILRDKEKPVPPWWGGFGGGGWSSLVTSASTCCWVDEVC